MSHLIPDHRLFTVCLTNTTSCVSLQPLHMNKNYASLSCTLDSSIQDGSGAGLIPAWTMHRNKQRAGFSGEQLAFPEHVHRYNRTRIDELRRCNEGAMTALTQVLQASLTEIQRSTVQRSTFEVDTKLTMLENSSANYEDIAFKFIAHVAQQDAALADELEELEKPDAPSVPRSSVTPEMLVTSKKVYNALCMLLQEKGARTT